MAKLLYINPEISGKKRLPGSAEHSWLYQNGNTALHYAASGGHGEVVETLLAGGADIRATNGVRVIPRPLLSAPPLELCPLGPSPDHPRPILRHSAVMGECANRGGWASKIEGQHAEILPLLFSGDLVALS